MKAIILAAGSGKRMKSELPKVLFKVAGKPLLHCVIDTCLEAGIDDITVVVGKSGEKVREATDHAVQFAWQKEQLGTGHAVICAKDHIDPDDSVVVLAGDAPLVTPDLLKNLMKFQQDKKVHGVVVSTLVPDPTGYGRVITTPSGGFEAIVEHRDLAPEQMDVKDINPSVYVFTGRELLRGLELIDNNNSQKEYYLTDVPKMMKQEGFKVAVYHDSDYLQFLGINSQKQLSEAAAVLRSRIIDKHFDNGVTIIDPNTTYIDADVEIGPGTVIKPCTVIEKSKIGSNCQIGPFAYIREDTVVGDRCRIGDFVELKKSTLGDDTKAAHLAYIGDAEIGNRVNFGCGAITVNYDSKLKNKTIVEDGAFVGSNVNLVAPITVGAGAYVAAGSTVVDDVPSEALAIARQRQVHKEGWAKK